MFSVWSSVLFCIYHSPSVSCFTEPFLVSVSSFSLVFLCCLVVWFLIFCLVYWINLLPAVSDSVRTSPELLLTLSDYPPLSSPLILFADRRHACWLEYSSVLSSIYLFATVWTRPVITMPLSNTTLQMDPHTSHLVGPVTLSPTLISECWGVTTRNKEWEKEERCYEKCRRSCEAWESGRTEALFALCW